jgi:hypothetical protein
MQALEMEEVESLVGPGRKKLNQSRQRKGNGTDGFAQVAVRRSFVTYIVGAAMVVIVLLLYVSTHEAATDTTNPDPSTKAPAEAASTVITAPTTDGGGPREPEPAPVALAAPPTAAPVVVLPATPPPTEPSPTEPPKTEGAADNDSTSENDMNLYSKYATFKPLMDPPLPSEENSQKLVEKWGKWSFWDGDEGMRPTKDYLSAYPNKDCPGESFPDDSWQVDAVFVNHYLNDADKLISRAMDAIFAEYGHPREGLEPEQLAERMKQFHWEKIDMANTTGPSPQYQKRGDRGNGGWTTKRSEKGLVRRLLHAMMTSDTFTVVMGGHSAAAGEG